MSPKELKKRLVEAGFQIYRTVGDDLVLAERVRENLIMDSGVRVRSGSPLQVRVLVSLRRGDHPNEDERTLFERVRRMAAPVLEHGFIEDMAHSSQASHPSHDGSPLDTFFEITYVRDAPSFEELVEGVKLGLSLAKTQEFGR